MKLLYAPMLYRFDKGLWPPTIIDAQYYDWQSILLAFFSISKMEVIWSGAHRNSVFKDPIPLLIKEQEIKNVKYKVGKINRLAKKVDWILVDHPSSVMLDAERMGKFCQCICPFEIDKQFIRDDLWYINNIWYSNENKALKHLEFLVKDFYGPHNIWHPTYLKKNKKDWLEEINVHR
jgi:hypothetical protein